MLDRVKDIPIGLAAKQASLVNMNARQSHLEQLGSLMSSLQSVRQTMQKSGTVYDTRASTTGTRARGARNGQEGIRGLFLKSSVSLQRKDGSPILPQEMEMDLLVIQEGKVGLGLKLKIHSTQTSTH